MAYTERCHLIEIHLYMYSSKPLVHRSSSVRDFNSGATIEASSSPREPNAKALAHDGKVDNIFCHDSSHYPNGFLRGGEV